MQFTVGSQNKENRISFKALLAYQISNGSISID